MLVVGGDVSASDFDNNKVKHNKCKIHNKTKNDGCMVSEVLATSLFSEICVCEGSVHLSFADLPPPTLCGVGYSHPEAGSTKGGHTGAPLSAVTTPLSSYLVGFLYVLSLKHARTHAHSCEEKGDISCIFLFFLYNIHTHKEGKRKSWRKKIKKTTEIGAKKSRVRREA